MEDMIYTEDSISGKSVREAVQITSLKEAYKGAYYKREELESIYNTVYKISRQNIIKRQLEIYKEDILRSIVPKKIVTSKQFVFRASTIAGEQTFITMNKKLISKAQKAALSDKSNTFWSSITKISLDNQNTTNYNISLIYRILSIKNSSTPSSQFVSHALNFKTAQNFDNGTGVFAYEIVPNSHLLGLSEQNKTLGEIQYQILGGTPIHMESLFWYNNKMNKWMKYNQYGKFEDTKIYPINMEYQELFRSIHDEL